MLNTQSQAFKDFIALCLVKRPEARADAKTLLAHPWLDTNGSGKGKGGFFNVGASASAFTDELFELDWDNRKDTPNPKPYTLHPTQGEEDPKP